MERPWVRSGVLVGAPELIRELGGDPVLVAVQAGLALSTLRDPDIPIPVRLSVLFLEKAAEHCQVCDFGLRLAGRQSLAVLGSVWVLLRQCKTVRQMTEDLARHFALHTTGATVSLEHVDNGMIVAYRVTSGVTTGDRQTIELGAAIFCNELRKHCPRGWQPASVQFCYAAPRDMSRHRQCFGTNLSFNQDRNALFLDAATLAIRLDDASARAHSVATATLHGDREPVQRTAPFQVESTIRALLPFAPCTLEEVAAALGVSPRTLQRQLSSSSSSFHDVRDRVRADLAMKYLRQSSLRLSDIAEILGYSELSAFTRSFRRWHGCSPRAARKHLDPSIHIPPPLPDRRAD